jgi:DNA-binding CsgD family transcriptional regulator
MAIQPTPPGAPVFLVRTRLQPLQPITRRQMAVIAMLSEGWIFKQIATFLGISLRTVRWHTTAAARRIPGDRPPIERVIAWYRGASLEVLTGHHVFSPAQLVPHARHLSQCQVAHDGGGMVAIPALAPSAAPAPDYGPPDPNEQLSLKSRSSPERS